MKSILLTLVGFIFVMSAGHAAGEHINQEIDQNFWSQFSSTN